MVLGTSDGSSSKAIADIFNPKEAKQQQMTQGLGQKLVVAIRQNPSKREELDPIQAALIQLSDFILALQLALAESELARAADDDLPKQVDRLKALAQEAAHHLTASKDLVRKIGRLLKRTMLKACPVLFPLLS